MKYLLCVLLCVMSPLALASGAAPPTFDWVALLRSLFGERGEYIAAWVSVVLVVWSQVRQLLPPAWLAKLPHWLIELLEFLAANKGKASNDLYNNPKYIKQSKADA